MMQEGWLGFEASAQPKEVVWLVLEGKLVGIRGHQLWTIENLCPAVRQRLVFRRAIDWIEDNFRIIVH